MESTNPYPYLVRKLKLSDYDGYIALVQEFRSTPNIISREMFEDFVQYKTPNTTIWVIEDTSSKSLIGMTSILYEYKLIYGGCIIGHIEDVCIHSAYRKKGLGSILLQRVIQEAKEKNCYKIVLNCMEHVLPFYLSNGFEQRGCNCSMLLKPLV